MTDLDALDRDIGGRERPGPRKEAACPWKEAAGLADLQGGVVGHSQLIGLGLGRDGIQHRVAVGFLRVLYRGVYAFGHPILRPHGHWMAAVLRCGPGAVLSHRSAAALWDLRSTARDRIEVTAPGRRRHSVAGIQVHNVRALHAEDRAHIDGVPVTSLHRLFLDLAEVLPLDAVRRVYEEADRRGLVDLRAIEQMIARSPGRRGLKPLSTLIREQQPVRFTRSELERMLLELCRRRGIPLPQTNAWVDGFEIDAYWPERRLMVEVDSWRYHGDRASFERDRARDTELQLAGYTVLRFTDRRLSRAADEIGVLIDRALRSSA